MGERIHQDAIAFAEWKRLLLGWQVLLAKEARPFLNGFGIYFGCRRADTGRIELHPEGVAVNIQLLRLHLAECLIARTGHGPGYQLFCQ